MNEGELDVLVSHFDLFVAGIRRACADIGKKGAADPRTLIGYVDRAMVDLGTLRREIPIPPELVVEAKQLDRKLDEIAAQLRSEGKTPTPEAIIKQAYVTPSVVALLTKQSASVLEERTMRDSATHASDRSKEKEKKTPDERNYTFEFYHHPKFKACPRKLDYIDPDTLQWAHPSIAEGLRKDWKQAIAQCSKNEKAMTAANDYLETLRKKYGDLPGPELLRLEAEATKKRKA